MDKGKYGNDATLDVVGTHIKWFRNGGVHVILYANDCARHNPVEAHALCKEQTSALNDIIELGTKAQLAFERDRPKLEGEENG